MLSDKIKGKSALKARTFLRERDKVHGGCLCIYRWKTVQAHARIQEFSSGGGSRSIWQKKLWQRFFCCFLVLSLFYRSQMVTFNLVYHFSRFWRGSNIFQGGGGVNFFQGGGGGGVQLLIPYRNPYNLWFSRGGPDPLSPLWIRTWHFIGETFTYKGLFRRHDFVSCHVWFFCLDGITMSCVISFNSEENWLGTLSYLIMLYICCIAIAKNMC